MLDEYTVLIRLHPLHAIQPLIAMNAPLLPEVLLGPRRDDEPALPLETEGVQRYVWEGAFGPMLIEVRDGAAFVNGQRVTLIREMREASEVRVKHVADQERTSGGA